MMATADGGIGLSLFVREKQMAGCGTYHRVDLRINLFEPFEVFAFVAGFLYAQFGPNGVEELFHRFLLDFLVGDKL